MHRKQTHRPANNVNNQSTASASTCIEINVNNPRTPAISGNNDISVLMTALKEIRKLTSKLRYVEACIVAINFKNQDLITLTSIYVPPLLILPIFILNNIEVLLQISPNQILCGDYNAHHTSWGYNYDCPRGNAINAFALQAGLEILAPRTPTKFGRNSENTIDFIIVKNLLYPYENHSISELSSDHNPITLNFFLQYSIPKYPGN
ncbi:hypothetical protein AVEN_757-1 [Araneus ventricosus]|uniref:Endonuclease/exonuclease/phosphatase domain-containing protein n=1 Tax=Araneus ventricosus TaxID=182803 RepID=A0A4Y2WRD7_ARAVE|nr:hypothetical protein AVEN_757-1 [Araneus ventricosus]